MASSADEYWEQRHEIVPSPAASDADSQRRLVLLVTVDDPGVLSAYSEIRNRLERFECFYPTPPDELHITIKTFENRFEPASTAADIADATVQRARSAIADSIADWRPFETTFPRINLFPDVVYAEAESGGMLTELNRALCRLPQTTRLARDDGSYIPHLTLGYFAGSDEYHDLVEFLEENRTLSFPTLSVDELALAICEVTDGHPPTYEILDSYDLQ
jgi:2'-5' RNA ligase